jgi:hypothetical protein
MEQPVEMKVKHKTGLRNVTGLASMYNEHEHFFAKKGKEKNIFCGFFVYNYYCLDKFR